MGGECRREPPTAFTAESAENFHESGVAVPLNFAVLGALGGEAVDVG
jgi:hypothetical protein